MKSEETPFRALSREERRERIIWAAKRAFFEKGFESASMEDVAAYAGTTKPTVYAHFKSREELIAAMLQTVRQLVRHKLQSPEVYASEPLEAISLYCARFVEANCWKDAIVYQRHMIALANQSPELSRGFFEALSGDAVASIAAYMQAHNLSIQPEQDAERLLSATAGWAVLKSLYASDEGPIQPDIEAIRKTVRLLAAGWK